MGKLLWVIIKKYFKDIFDKQTNKQKKQKTNATRATSGALDETAYMRMTHFHVMPCSQAPSPTIQNDPNLKNNKPTQNPATTPLLICPLLPMNNDCMLDMVLLISHDHHHHHQQGTSSSAASSRRFTM